jgi:hypothetical protein
MKAKKRKKGEGERKGRKRKEKEKDTKGKRKRERKEEAVDSCPSNMTCVCDTNDETSYHILYTIYYYGFLPCP